MTNYFRITGYCPEKNFSFIMDCYGKFEKKWQFSAELVKRGLKIIEVSDDEQFLEGNMPLLVNPPKSDGKFVVLSSTFDGRITLGKPLVSIPNKFIK